MVKNILLRVVGVGGGGGWEEKWGLKLTSAKVELKLRLSLAISQKYVLLLNSC